MTDEKYSYNQDDKNFIGGTIRKMKCKGCGEIAVLMKTGYRWQDGEETDGADGLCPSCREDSD